MDNRFLPAPSLTPFPAGSRCSGPAWNNSWLDVGAGAAELCGGGGRGGGGGSFVAGPWRRAVSEHVSLRFRRGRKGLASGKEALRAASTAAALHLLLPPSSLRWFLRQVQDAETPCPSVPCSSSPGLRAIRPAGSCSPSLLGVQAWTGGGPVRGWGKGSVWGVGPDVNQSLSTPFSSRRLRALCCPLIIVGAGWCRADCRMMLCELVGSLEERREKRAGLQ